MPSILFVFFMIVHGAPLCRCATILLLLFATLPTSGSDNKQFVRERQSLVDLYWATSGPQWANKTRWLTSFSHCTWHGVTCDSAEAVVGLSLGRNYLRGVLPESLGTLTSLRSFAATHNSLKGGLPYSIGRLVKLELLYLFMNTLTAFPPTLTSASSLKELYLANNRITTSLPNDFGSLKALKVVHMHANHISGTIPESVKELRNLTQLFLYRNDLTGTIPFALLDTFGPSASLPALKALRIRKNRFCPCPFPPQISSIAAVAKQQWRSELPSPIGAYENADRCPSAAEQVARAAGSDKAAVAAVCLPVVAGGTVVAGSPSSRSSSSVPKEVPVEGSNSLSSLPAQPKSSPCLRCATSVVSSSHPLVVLAFVVAVCLGFRVWRLVQLSPSHVASSTKAS